MKEYFYDLDLLYKSKGTSSVRSYGLSDIEVVTADKVPFTNKNKWTPVQLLGAYAASDLMSVFLSLAENSKIEILSYQSQCFIKLEKEHDNYFPAEILIRPKIKLLSEGKLNEAGNLMDQAESIFPAKNILNMIIKVHAQIESK